MDATLKKKWCEALRSGRFAQSTAGFALGNKKGPQVHSALSVLADILELPRTPLYSGVKTDWVVVDERQRPAGLLPISIRNKIGLGALEAQRVAYMGWKLNWDFKYIAHWIEENL